MARRPFFLRAEQFLAAGAARDGDAEALVYRDRRLTYGQLNTLANRFADELRARGVRPGDRVALYLAKSVEKVVAFFGVLKARAVCVVVNSAYKADQVQAVLADAGVRLTITTDVFAGMLGGRLGSLSCLCCRLGAMMIRWAFWRGGAGMIRNWMGDVRRSRTVMTRRW